MEKERKERLEQLKKEFMEAIRSLHIAAVHDTIRIYYEEVEHIDTVDDATMEAITTKAEDLMFMTEDSNISVEHPKISPVDAALICCFTYNNRSSDDLTEQAKFAKLRTKIHRAMGSIMDEEEEIFKNEVGKKSGTE